MNFARQQAVQAVEEKEDLSLFCYCKGKNQSDYYLGCEGEDQCERGGWFHPECVPQIKGLSPTEIENIGKWFCPECTKRIEKPEPIRIPFDSESESPLMREPVRI